MVELDERELAALIHLLRAGKMPSYQLRKELIGKFEAAIQRLMEDESFVGRSLRE